MLYIHKCFEDLLIDSRFIYNQSGVSFFGALKMVNECCVQGVCGSYDTFLDLSVQRFGSLLRHLLHLMRRQ